MATTDDYTNSITNGVLDAAERARLRHAPDGDDDMEPLEEGGIESVTISSGGRSVNLKPRQFSMLGAHPEMDEHVGLVESAVKKMAARIIDGGDDGEFTAKLKIKREFETSAGVVMEATYSIQVSAKPAKPEKE